MLKRLQTLLNFLHFELCVYLGVSIECMHACTNQDYASLRDTWVREGKVFILVYSITDEVMMFPHAHECGHRNSRRRLHLPAHPIFQRHQASTLRVHARKNLEVPSLQNSLLNFICVVGLFRGA